MFISIVINFSQAKLATHKNARQRRARLRSRHKLFGCWISKRGHLRDAVRRTVWLGFAFPHSRLEAKTQPKKGCNYQFLRGCATELFGSWHQQRLPHCLGFAVSFAHCHNWASFWWATEIYIFLFLLWKFTCTELIFSYCEYVAPLCCFKKHKVLKVKIFFHIKLFKFSLKRNYSVLIRI